MSDSATEQQAESPNAEADPRVEILTEATPVRAINRLISPLVDECKWQFDADGLSITAVDPANVGMVDLTCDGDGFGTYRFEEETTFGMNLAGYFGPTVQYARMNKDDPVKLSVNDDWFTARVTRPDQRVQRETSWKGIDPASIREEPDIPNLELPNRAKPEMVKALGDIARELDKSADYVRISQDDGTLLLHQEMSDGEVEDVFRLTDAVEEAEAPDASSIFSLDYLKDFFGAVHNAKMDRMTIRWGDEFPTKIYFEQNEWGYSGEFMLAPRIQSE